MKRSRSARANWANWGSGKSRPSSTMQFWTFKLMMVRSSRHKLRSAVNATSESLKGCIAHSDVVCVCVSVPAIALQNLVSEPCQKIYTLNVTLHNEPSQTILFFQLLHDVISSCCRRQGNGDHKPKGSEICKIWMRSLYDVQCKSNLLVKGH